MDTIISQVGRSHLKWSLIDGVGPITFRRIVEHFGNLDIAECAPAAQLEKVQGVGPKIAREIIASRNAVNIDTQLELAHNHGVRIICLEDPDYPEGLRQIPDPPIVLYVKGDLRPTDAVAVAVVGTRKCSIYGSEQARRFAELLAQSGFTVVSGLARGIDSFAHYGAVEANGRTIAVLGNGLTEIFPPENTALAEKLLDFGALVSELPMKSEVRRGNFPSRNRIIAGMSLGTIVIEAPSRSGALITARLANDYNREVFAVPGRLLEPNAVGPNRLIRDGIGKLVTNLEDIVLELGDLGKAMLDRIKAAQAEEEADKDQQKETLPPISLTPLESRVFDVTERSAMRQDQIITASELAVHEVLAALTSLELKGLIQRLPGQMVARR